MKIPFVDHIGTALLSLKMNRVRSFLTALGITIGVASITAILALSAGVTNMAKEQVSKVGDSIAVIRPGAEQEVTTEALLRPNAAPQYNVSTLTEVDVDALKKKDKHVHVAPLMKLTATLKASKTKVQGVQVTVTSPEFAKTNPLDIQDGGQFIDTLTAKNNGAVLGAQLAIDLFGTDNPIGNVFKIKEQNFTVVGVLKRATSPVNYSSIDFDNTAIIPVASGKLLSQGVLQVQQINIHAKDQAKLGAFVASAENILIKRHGEKDFTIKSGQDVATPTNKIFTIMTGVLTAIAAISLVVGGIGVMNIMLVSVAERTREIGIRKAVGASNASIASQFLIESLTISLIGGVFGYIIGNLLAFTISTTLYFTPVFTWDVVMWASIVSVGIGLVFGIYPAVRASRKDPIESLRQYR